MPIPTITSFIKHEKKLIICSIILGFIFYAVYQDTFSKKVISLGDNATYYIGGKAIAAGKGYTSINNKEPSYSSHYPPGYSTVIATIMKLKSKKNILLIKRFNGLFFFIAMLITLLFVYKITKDDSTPLTATLLGLITAFYLAVNGHLLFYSTTMMSEASFTLFVMLALFSFHFWADEKEYYKNPFFYITLFSIFSAYYIRTIGISLMVMFPVYLLIQKKWQKSIVLFLWSIVTYLPLYIRNSIHGVGKSNSQVFWSKNHWRPELGHINTSELLERIWENIVRYGEKEFPSSFFPALTIDYAEDAKGYLITGLFLVAFMIIGLIVTPKKYRLYLFSFIFCYYGILAITPSNFWGVRYLIPSYPIIFYLCFKGLVFTLESIAHYLFQLPKEKAKYAVLILPVFLFIDYVRMDKVTAENDSLVFYKVYELSVINKQPLQKPWSNYYKCAKWMRKNSSDTSHVCCTKPSLFYLYASRHTTGITKDTNTVHTLDALTKKGITHVVIDQLGFSRTTVYLYPALVKHPNKFREVKRWGNTDEQNGVFLYEYLPHMGYNGDWVDGKKEGTGSFNYSSGDSYEGKWKNDRREGYGVYHWKNGMTFKGEWSNDLRNGPGVLKTKDLTVNGNWVNDKYHGRIIVTSKTGQKIEQIWDHGKALSQKLIQ